jgi:hypothetical protein
MADTANERLPSWLLPSTTASIPNLVYLDNIKDTVPLNFAVSANAKKMKQTLQEETEDAAAARIPGEIEPGTYIKDIEFPVGYDINEARREIGETYTLFPDPVGKYAHGNIYLAHSTTDDIREAFYDLDGTNNPNEKKNERPVIAVAILEPGQTPEDQTTAGSSSDYEELLKVDELGPGIKDAKIIVVKRG